MSPTLPLLELQQKSWLKMDSSSTTNSWLEIANINVNSCISSEDASPVMSEDMSVEKMGEFYRTKDAPYPYKVLIYLIN